jgi:hypothetical protein
MGLIEPKRGALKAKILLQLQAMPRYPRWVIIDMAREIKPG